MQLNKINYEKISRSTKKNLYIEEFTQLVPNVKEKTVLSFDKQFSFQPN